jgi:hypothetical protein
LQCAKFNRVSYGISDGPDSFFDRISDGISDGGTHANSDSFTHNIPMGISKAVASGYANFDGISDWGARVYSDSFFHACSVGISDGCASANSDSFSDGISDGGADDVTDTLARRNPRLSKLVYLFPCLHAYL